MEFRYVQILAAPKPAADSAKPLSAVLGFIVGYLGAQLEDLAALLHAASGTYVLETIQRKRAR